MPLDQGGEAQAGDEGFYARDVAFRSGVVAHQSPLAMAYAAAANGFAPPSPRGCFRYCDLGCGDGTTLNALASVNPEASFLGVDFNAGHVARAREAARAAGLDNVEYVQASFTELHERDLPTFDFVAMNGIYAWLEEPAARAVRSFLGAHLRPGGLFYVEYTCLPGKVSVLPLWHLIQSLVPETGQGSRARAEDGLELLDELAAGGMAYLNAHQPAARAARFYLSGRRSSGYAADHFAHNAMASGFRPRFFTQMWDEMAEAGLLYAGRAEARLNELELCVPAGQVALLRRVEDRRVRELLLDFIRNEQQRRDVFVMRGTPDTAAARRFLMRDVALIGRRPAARIAREIEAPGGRRVSLRGAGYDALVAGFDGAPRTLRQVKLPEPVGEDSLLAAARRLYAGGQYVLCHPGQDVAPSGGVPEHLRMANPVNRTILRDGVAACGGATLVAQATGGAAVGLGPLEAVLLQAWLRAGRAGAPAAARADLAGRRDSIRINGEDVPAGQIGESSLRAVADRMAGGKLRLMCSLGIVGGDSDG